jgi:hypothetical protein
MRCLNAIMYFIMLEEGIFLTFWRPSFPYTNQILHGRGSTEAMLGAARRSHDRDLIRTAERLYSFVA